MYQKVMYHFETGENKRFVLEKSLYGFQELQDELNARFAGLKVRYMADHQLIEEQEIILERGYRTFRRELVSLHRRLENGFEKLPDRHRVHFAQKLSFFQRLPSLDLTKEQSRKAFKAFLDSHPKDQDRDWGYSLLDSQQAF